MNGIIIDCMNCSRCGHKLDYNFAGKRPDNTQIWVTNIIVKTHNCVTIEEYGNMIREWSESHG